MILTYDNFVNERTNPSEYLKNFAANHETEKGVEFERTLKYKLSNWNEWYKENVENATLKRTFDVCSSDDLMLVYKDGIHIATYNPEKEELYCMHKDLKYFA